MLRRLLSLRLQKLPVRPDQFPELVQPHIKPLWYGEIDRIKVAFYIRPPKPC